MWKRFISNGIALSISLMSHEVYGRELKTDIKGIKLGMSLSDAENASMGVCTRNSLPQNAFQSQCLIGHDRFLIFTSSSQTNHPAEKILYEFDSQDSKEIMLKNVETQYDVKLVSNFVVYYGSIGQNYSLSLVYEGSHGQLTIENIELEKLDKDAVNSMPPTTKF